VASVRGNMCSWKGSAAALPGAPCWRACETTMTIACVFPGQGSQKVGMLDAFAAQPDVAGLLAAADAALGEPISALIANGPAEDLALTVNTQPAMLLAGYGCYLAWRGAGGPACLPGGQGGGRQARDAPVGVGTVPQQPAASRGGAPRAGPGRRPHQVAVGRAGQQRRRGGRVRSRPHPRRA